MTSEVSEYVAEKVGVLRRSVKENEAEIASSQERIEFALTQSRRAVSSQGLTLAERLLVQANANRLLNFYERRETNLRANLNSLEQLLSLAEHVEESRVVEPAVAVRTDATSGRNAALIGALAGLILGLIAAYVWDPVVRRRGAQAS